MNALFDELHIDGFSLDRNLNLVTFFINGDDEYFRLVHEINTPILIQIWNRDSIIVKFSRKLARKNLYIKMEDTYFKEVELKILTFLAKNSEYLKDTIYYSNGCMFARK